MKTTTIRTAGNVRDQKHLADAKQAYNDELRARIEREQKEYIAARLSEYPQIGILCSGKFYAYAGGQYVESFFLSRVIDAIEDAR